MKLYNFFSLILMGLIIVLPLTVAIFLFNILPEKVSDAKGSINFIDNKNYQTLWQEASKRTRFSSSPAAEIEGLQLPSGRIDPFRP